MSNEAELRDYFKDIERAYGAGNATEHTYRPYLKALLERLAPGATAVNEPKRIACGAPDYAITRKDSSGLRTIGYVEAKDIGVSLEETLRTDQLHRYLGSLDNLILTDYLEFRWFVRRDGKMEERPKARIATVGPNRKLAPDAKGMVDAANLLTSMLGQKAPAITSPRDLAERMARMAHMIRNVALETVNADLSKLSREERGTVEPAKAALADLLETFKKTLLPELKVNEFADMFAQTLAYGLFAARYNHNGPARTFTRHDAAREIPRSNPFLRHLFSAIESPDLEDAPYVGFVDDLAQLLAEADMAAILRDFGKRTRTEDPIVHFYETFLAAYDPKLRELRGVYYTPEPVVTYIVRSVDRLLKGEFGLPDGLASDRVVSDPARDHQPVVLLDPACGTGTFLYTVVNHIRDRFRERGDAGAWPTYVRQRLLPRLFGFELLMAPYAMAHLKLGMQLAGLDLPEAERDRWAVQTGGDERLGVYLTNTLEEPIFRTEHLFRGQFITDEANDAAKVKRDVPVMVVLGNPPYSGHSANKGKWVSELVDTYKEGIPELKKPGQGKWLRNDYVKFIRFGQWRIERSGYGILAFITDNSYLDNPTFRGMRQSLMGSFDEIYVLDLHGNSNKKERTPDGGKDENVFDIQQGVAIALFIRRRGTATGDRRATIYHADLWGTRTYKYEWLTEYDIETTRWAQLEPQEPLRLFTPRDVSHKDEYEKYPTLPEIFNQNGDPAPGVVTTQDDFAVSWTKDEAIHKVEQLLATSDEAQARGIFRLCSQDQWSYSRAKTELASGKWRTEATQLVYRPFDSRWTIWNSNVAVHRRQRVMRHMLAGNNLALITTRQTRDVWDALATRSVIGHKALAAYDINSLFPLYLYPDSSKPNLWGAEAPSTAPGGRRANLAPEFIAEMARRLGLTWVPDGNGDRVRSFGPEDVFSYIYAIFHAPSYRERYADFLKSDFPRVPLTSDAHLFRELCTLGDRLVALHLLEAEGDSAGRPIYPVRGSDLVEQLRYTEPDAARGIRGRVYINRDQYFDGVEPETWEFHIGGYQVAEKWLKDRKGRTLSYDDIEHYEKTLAALAETTTLMEQIDGVIEEHGGWPLARSIG